MARKAPVNYIEFLKGGATSPSIALSQFESGRCRLYWYVYDQEGFESHDIQTFKEKDWNKAIERGRKITTDFIESATACFSE